MRKKHQLSSIAILIPYFGKWPFWIELFVESCKRNPTIDWFFFSDCGRLDSFSENIKYQNVTFKEYKSLVSSKLSIDFDPSSAYKLCDIKPALGFIHEDLILNYDFWGFGDLDLVYGDLRTLYTEKYLSKFNLYSNHATRVSGHLCLLRNTKEMRNVFRKIPKWQDKFSNQLHMAIDEKDFSRIFVKHKNLPNSLRRILKYIYPLSRRSDFVESYTTPNGCIAWHDGSYSFPDKWFWCDGVIKNSSSIEYYYPYFHFAVWKKENWIKNVEHLLVKYNCNMCYLFDEDGIEEVESFERYKKKN